MIFSRFSRCFREKTDNSFAQRHFSRLAAESRLVGFLRRWLFRDRVTEVTVFRSSKSVLCYSLLGTNGFPRRPAPVFLFERPRRAPDVIFSTRPPFSPPRILHV